MKYEAGALKEQRKNVAILKLSRERPNKRLVLILTYVYAGSKMRRFVTSNKIMDYWL